MAKYTNPFYSPKILGSQPEIQTDVQPIEHKGYLIYERIKGSVWDIVKDGICVTMMAGLNGAKRAIDMINKKQKGKKK